MDCAQLSECGMRNASAQENDNPKQEEGKSCCNYCSSSCICIFVKERDPVLTVKHKQEDAEFRYLAVKRNNTLPTGNQYTMKKKMLVCVLFFYVQKENWYAK